MRTKLTTLLTVIGAVTVLVLAADTIVFAAAGKALLGGKTNKTSKVTTIKRKSAGPALKVVTKSKADAPFAVNGTGKVANLNADTVDGVDSTALTTTAYDFTVPVSTPMSTVDVMIPVANGTYLLNYSAYLASGGGAAQAFCELRSSEPGKTRFVGSSWYAPSSGDPALTGSGLLTKTSANAIRFECVSYNGVWTTPTNQPIQVVATRVDTVVASTLPPS